jgi:PTH1 family peptidyl-tRNA hydrolase
VYWKKKFDGQELLLAKPTTYMNASGLAVREFIGRFELRSEDIVVISDDVALPWGFVRIRDHGRSGGHKGVESIITELQNDNFLRVRVGIRPRHTVRDLSSYVLAPLPESGELKEEAELGIITATEAVEKILRDGPMFAMATYNKKVPLN